MFYLFYNLLVGQSLKWKDVKTIETKVDIKTVVLGCCFRLFEFYTANCTIVIFVVFSD